MADRTRYWAVVPAAGVGARMEVELPKQYLTLAGTTVLQRSLDTLLAFEPLEKIVVALSRDDRRWPSLPAAGDSRVATVAGGAERCDSVLAGLRGLAEQAAPGDWVVVPRGAVHSARVLGDEAVVSLDAVR